MNQLEWSLETSLWSHSLRTLSHQIQADECLGREDAPRSSQPETALIPQCFVMNTPPPPRPARLSCPGIL